MAEKMTKQELKQPDALQRAGMDATHWLEGKEKFLIGGLVALVVIGLLAAIVDAMGDRAETRAERALGAALEPLTRTVQEGETPPPAAANAEDPPFPTQKAKDEALVESLTKFREEHDGTRSATTAALPLGQALYRLGRHDDALKALDEYLSGARGDEQLRAVALEAKGYVHEAKGDLPRALEAFDELANFKEPFLQGMGMFHRGRILVLQNQKEEAAKVFAQVPEQFPNSAAARQAQERLNLLASQGVAVPAPKPPAEKPAAEAGTGGAAGQK